MIFLLEIGQYQSKRDENRSLGFMLDLFSLGFCEVVEGFYNVLEIEDVDIVIFVIMAIVTMVVSAISVTRFVYIDPKYAEIIKNYESKSENRDDMKSYFQEGQYQTSRKENKSFGLKVDLFAIFGTVLLGCLLAFVAHEPIHIVVISILPAISIYPIVNLMGHLSKIKKPESKILLP